MPTAGVSQSQRLAQGKRGVCRRVPHLPNTHLTHWLRQRPEFRRSLSRGRHSVAASSLQTLCRQLSRVYPGSQAVGLLGGGPPFPSATLP